RPNESGLLFGLIQNNNSFLVSLRFDNLRFEALSPPSGLKPQAPLLLQTTISPLFSPFFLLHAFKVNQQSQSHGSTQDDDNLRYVGGLTRVLATDASIFFAAFAAMVDGKSQEMSTKELSGGARIHYILQPIFVKCLEEVDPCDDLIDDDFRMAIQNASGVRNALFVPEVPFEFLVRRQIARRLDPSLQCLRFVYDELMKVFPFAFAIVSGETMDNWRWQQRISNLLLGV
ncbi:dynamin-related protein 3A, partial [Prunus dulcis]